MFGKLTLDAVPYHEPIIVVTVAAIIIGGAALLALITYFGKWSYLWNEWLTSVDHKKLGIMYCIVGIVMLIRGFADAIMMRSQQALASAGEAGFLPPHHYDQIFTAHGVIMIFFVAMPLVIGLMNVVVPLQIGARDVAFPFLNNLSFWFWLSALSWLTCHWVWANSRRPAGWHTRRYQELSTVRALALTTGSGRFSSPVSVPP